MCFFKICIENVSYVSEDSPRCFLGFWAMQPYVSYSCVSYKKKRVRGRAAIQGMFWHIMIRIFGQIPNNYATCLSQSPVHRIVRVTSLKSYIILNILRLRLIGTVRPSHTHPPSPEQSPRAYHHSYQLAFLELWITIIRDWSKFMGYPGREHRQ